MPPLIHEGAQSVPLEIEETPNTRFDDVCGDGIARRPRCHARLAQIRCSDSRGDRLKRRMPGAEGDVKPDADDRTCRTCGLGP